MRLKELRAFQLASEFDGQRPTPWTFGTTMRAHSKLKPNTSAGSGDNVVPEMLRALSWITCMIVHECFIQRDLGSSTAIPQSWYTIVMVLLGKVRNPT